MKKIWEFLNKNLLITIVVLLILGLGAVVYFQNKRIVNLADKYQTEVNLKNALLDTVTTYQNKQNEWVTEKLTIQANMNHLKDMNGQLTDSQKDLVKRIEGIEKNSSIIAAALIETNILIDSLRNSKGIVNEEDTTITFKDSTENINYNFIVKNAVPISPFFQPILKFKKLSLPNTQFIEFHWEDNKKLGYPTAFSVTNTNKYYKTENINSYAIPEIKKNELDPTGWHKVGKWFMKNGKTILYVAAGAGGTYLLVK